MIILIFDNQITGHHLEYLHHNLIMASEHPNDTFIFVIPKQINEIRDNLNWVEYPNVRYDYLDSEIKPASSSIVDMLKTSYMLCKILRIYVMRHNAEMVYTNGIMAFVPFGPILLPLKTRIVGIIYQIYLYNDKESSFQSKILNRIKYFILSKCRLFKKVLILNSKKSADKFNEIYHSDKFEYLPDPANELPIDKVEDLRKKYNISPEKIIFAHFGELSERKGTLNIIDSFQYVSQENFSKMIFIFAGVVKDDIKKIFYEKIKHYKNVFVEDGFCSYAYLGSLCQCANIILLPYLLTNLSSGLLSYASQFSRPVLAPNTGLIGELVNEYNLGILLKENTPQEISVECQNAILKQYIAPTKYYCNTHTIAAFNKVIYNSLT